MNEQEIKECLKKGLEIWHTESQVRRWMETSSRALGGKAPIECTKHEVLAEICRIQYGVYS